jgi:hypothetical protein
VDLDDAEHFLEDRHLLTLTPDCTLPSLFGACAPVSDPKARGFATWPEDKWWWDGALADRAGCTKTKLHRGKVLFLDARAVEAVDGLCREEEICARAGSYGSDAERLVAFLDAVGPVLLDEVKANTVLDTKALRRARAQLEPRGAVVSREVTVDAASGGHRHASELALWSQRQLKVAPGGDLSELAQLAVRAAVLVPRAEVRNWFVWPITNSIIDELVDGQRLFEPRPGWLTARQ